MYQQPKKMSTKKKIELIVYKDYSKGFNIEFDGNVILKIIINKNTPN